MTKFLAFAFVLVSGLSAHADHFINPHSCSYDPNQPEKGWNLSLGEDLTAVSIELNGTTLDEDLQCVPSERIHGMECYWPIADRAKYKVYLLISGRNVTAQVFTDGPHESHALSGRIPCY